MYIYKKRTTVFGISIAFFTSFSLLVFLLGGFHDTNYISLEEKQFYSQTFDENQRKIFILGASPVNAINSKIVDGVVQTADPNFKTYNLAKGSDDPDKRKSSLDLIIKNKPEIVLYGIGLRDFHELYK